MFAALSKASEERYRVLFDYDPENSDELGLEQDDIVIVTNKDVCDGWWEGTCRDKKGVFPNNFVELCPPKTEEITKVCNFLFTNHTLIRFAKV